ncbi:MAG: SRPBCC domain-containing protein [Pseudomonadota bacterium]|nr:SRPBCC domain-containing protein [Pseudomonadota bacterium]
MQMMVLTSKWFLGALVALLVLLSVLFVLGKKSVHTERIIEASPEKVWSVLMNTSEYKNWNQVLVPISIATHSGELSEGADVIYEFFQEPGSSYKIPSRVKQLIPERMLNQRGGTPGVLTFDHRYILMPQSDNTLLIVHEDYRGVAVPFWDPAPVEEAYRRLAKALNNRVMELEGSE